MTLQDQLRALSRHEHSDLSIGKDAADAIDVMAEALEPFAARATTPGAGTLADDATVTFFMKDVRAAFSALYRQR